MSRDDVIKKLQERKHAGLVLFSSGSTGEPKIVLHDWNKLVAKAMRKPNPAYRNWTVIGMLGMDHIGGVNTLLFCLANQCRLVFPESRTPNDVMKCIEHNKVQILPTTPSFLRMTLMRGAHRDFDTSSLRLITYGTEPMDDDLLALVSEAFPAAILKQTYGLTEVGILSTKSKNRGSLMMKVGGDGYQTRVVDGMLEIKAETSMVGYLNAPDPFTEDGWFKTMDRVVQDGDYLMILGRESDFINVGGDKVNPLDVEKAICTIPGILDCAAYGVPNEIMGQVVGVTIQTLELNNVGTLKRMIKQFLKTTLPKYAMPVQVKVTREPLTNDRMKKSRRDSLQKD